MYFVERDYPSTFRVRRYDLATQATTDVRGPASRLALAVTTDQTSLYWLEGAGADATELWTVKLP